MHNGSYGKQVHISSKKWNATLSYFISNTMTTESHDDQRDSLISASRIHLVENCEHSFTKEMTSVLHFGELLSFIKV